MRRFIVITTINPKSEGISAFEQIKDWHLVVVGDEKSNFIESSDKLTFLSLEDQIKLDYQFVKKCPLNHYSRKNIGYLYAIQKGADIIYEADDDNIPYTEWALPAFYCNNVVVSKNKYINIYRYFTGEFIWPRGFPLDELRNEKQDRPSVKKAAKVNIGVWQGLADEDPDTDAVYRLTVGRNIKFDKADPVYLAKSHFCPVNSQNTFWCKETFPFLYLPSTTSFRFTDILRGYIAQRLMWQHYLHAGFTHATVYQRRNPHDIMKDFEDEVASYLQLKGIIKILEKLNIGCDSIKNMQEVYKALCKASFLSAEELEHLNLWIEDYKSLRSYME